MWTPLRKQKWDPRVPIRGRVVDAAAEREHASDEDQEVEGKLVAFVLIAGGREDRRPVEHRMDLVIDPAGI
jgi:hypothetical protein